MPNREPLFARAVYRSLQAIARRLINMLWSNGGEVADIEVPQGRIVVVRLPRPYRFFDDPGYKVCRLGVWYGYEAVILVPREEG